MGARLSYLTDADKTAIYDAALDIMATIGQRVHHPEALELLRAAGAEVVEPDLVKVPRELVEKARRTAPPVIEVYDRGGEHAMSLGRYNTYFGNGSAVTSVYDVETGEHRPTVLADGEMAARLCDALPNVDFVMAYAHPGDIDPHRALLASFRAMVKNTTKPLCVVAENAADLAAMTDIAEAVRGDGAGLATKPYFVLYLEPTSALSHPVDSLDQAALLRRPRHPRRSTRRRRWPAARRRSPSPASSARAPRSRCSAWSSTSCASPARRSSSASARRCSTWRRRRARTTRPSTSWATSAPWRWRAGSTCPTGATRAPQTPR